jgi:hypothetical protein
MPEVYCGAKIKSGVRGGAGTVTCFLEGNFFDAGRKDTVLLTNKHVCNWKRIAAYWNKLKKDDQPLSWEEKVEKMGQILKERVDSVIFKAFEYIFLFDGGASPIAFQPLCTFAVGDPNPEDNLPINLTNYADDFAIAILTTGVNYHNVGFLDEEKPNPKTVPLTHIISPQECMRRKLPVYKIGWKTGLTKGMVVQVDEKKFGVENLEKNKPFSASGDSGSVVYTEEGRVLGQLFMGASTDSPRTTCTRMDYIIWQLVEDFGMGINIGFAGTGGF